MSRSTRSRRAQVNPVVSVGHHNYTGMTPVHTATDAPYVRIETPDLDWLHRIDITLDLKAGTVKIEVRMGDADANQPDLIVRRDGNFTVQS